METDNSKKRPHVSVGKSVHKSKKVFILVAVFGMTIIFVGGIFTGKWLKTQEINDAVSSSVGPSQQKVEATSVQYLGKTIQYTTDSDANAAIDRDFLFALKREDIEKGDINDLVVLYIKARDLGTVKPKELIGEVLKKRASEVSSAQKLQLGSNGLNL